MEEVADAGIVAVAINDLTSPLTKSSLDEVGMV